MFCPVPKPPPKQKKTPKGLTTKSHLKAKNKNPLPKPNKVQIYTEQGGICNDLYCNRPIDSFHHIIKRSQASPEWVHDRRNVEGLCLWCHEKTETDHEYRLSRELEAVKRRGWLAGRPMTVEQWKEWRGR